MMRDLLPEALIAGGSFASLLPPARTLSPDARRAEHEQMRALAVEQCLADIVTAAGLPAGTSVQHAAGCGPPASTSNAKNVAGCNWMLHWWEPATGHRVSTNRSQRS